MKRGAEDESDGEIRNKKRIKPTGLEYSERYAQWFNSQAAEFILGVSHGGSDLEAGHVTVSGSVVLPQRVTKRESFRQKDRSTGESIVGSYWTQAEKEKFFTFLGRKSRHRLDEVAEAIGTKSVVEVEEYHDLLYRAAAAKSVIRQEDIPAAVEMSDDFVSMEEGQARSIAHAEVAVALRSTKMAQTRANRAGKPSELLENPNLKLSWHDQIVRNVNAFDKEEENVDTLINAHMLMHIAGAVFWNAYYDDTIREYKQRPQLHYLARSIVTDLEDEVKWVVKSVLVKAFGFALRRQSDSRPQHEVTHIDVRNALKEMKLDIDREAYWSKVARRINLQLNDNKPEVVERLLRQRHSRWMNLAKNEPIEDEDAIMQNEKEHERLEQMGFESEESDLEPVSSQYSSDVRYYSIEEKENEPNERPVSVIEQDDEQQRRRVRHIADLTAQKETTLCRQETEKLEGLDKYQSRLEEHAILTFLCTADDEEQLHEDNARQLLKLWEKHRDTRFKWNRPVKWGHTKIKLKEQNKLADDDDDAESQSKDNTEASSDSDSEAEASEDSESESDSSVASDTSTAPVAVSHGDVQAWSRHWDRSGYDIS